LVNTKENHARFYFYRRHAGILSALAGLRARLRKAAIKETTYELGICFIARRLVAVVGLSDLRAAATGEVLK
jgi:hypothetical protein